LRAAFLPDATKTELFAVKSMQTWHSETMNSDTLLQLVQNSFRITLGATASLVEVLQNPQKRDESLGKLSQEWSQLSQEWAVKGETTEQEARNFVNQFMNQRGGFSGFNRGSSAASSGYATTPTAAPTAPADVQVELQELTAQIAAIRAELEKIRESEN
jgi:hypothetical protein